MKWISRLIVWGSLAVLLVSTMTPWINPLRIAHWNAFSVIHPWLYLWIGCLCMICLLQGSKLTKWLLLGLVLCSPSMFKFFQFSGEKSEGPAAFTLMSYNVGSFYPQTVTDKPYISFIENLKYGNADILCTQEAYGFLRKRLLQTPLYRHRYGGDQTHGPMILSRYPMVDHGELQFSSPVNACVWADIRVEGDTIRIYNVHFRSARISVEADALITGESKTNKEALDRGKFILKNFLKTSQSRTTEALTLLDHAESCPYASYIVGDFNETAHSYVYRRLRQGRKDSFREAGKGIAATYRGKIPGLRIDHVLLPKGHRALSHTTLPWTYSDHKPVLVGLASD